MSSSPHFESETNSLYKTKYSNECQRVNRIITWLMVIQWFAGILLATTYSPLTWIGQTWEFHVHLWAAVLLGGAISGFTILWTRLHPRAAHTRHVIAATQMLWSALLIHLSGGRIETHFHVFASLAILSMYRDWKILITATVVVSIDHCVRGVFFPLSAFGIVTESPYRWIEHAAWVLFEVAFLVPGCIRLRNEFRELCFRQTEIEKAKQSVDIMVRERTEELVATNRMLAEKSERLIDASHKAGMAEVANGVLHNVGNILNSVNVSASMIRNEFEKSALTNLVRVTDLIAEHESTFAEFVRDDQRGQKIPQYVKKVTSALSSERENVGNEFHDLLKNIEHIKKIIAVQQTLAKSSGGLVQEISPGEVIDDALTATNASLSKYQISVTQHIEGNIADFVSDKHKILQVLINLINNAKDALVQHEIADPTIRIEAVDRRREVAFLVIDNGIGIEPNKIDRIFQHGFTTKKSGHGFGLHSSANAATEIGGSLKVSSGGKGQGATFELSIPKSIQQHTCQTIRAIAASTNPGNQS